MGGGPDQTVILHHFFKKETLARESKEGEGAKKKREIVF